MVPKPVADITVSKLRSGAPDALAALCERRGAAVYAYCRQVVGDDHAAVVTADAFAQFRLAVIAPGGLTASRQAEALLRHVARRAALTHLFDAGTTVSGDPVTDECRSRSAGLLAYLGNEVSPAEREAVGAHVGRCGTCAATLQRLEAGEPAFSEANPALPPSVAQQILTAMARAAPVTAGQADAAPVLAHEPEPEPEPEPAAIPWADHDFPDDAPEPPAGPIDGRVGSTAPLPGPIAAALPEIPAGFPGPTTGRRGVLGRLRHRRHANAGVSRASMVARRLIRVLLVAAVAGAAGVGIGIGISELTGDEAAAPTPAAPLSPTTSTSTVTGE